MLIQHYDFNKLYDLANKYYEVYMVDKNKVTFNKKKAYEHNKIVSKLDKITKKIGYLEAERERLKMELMELWQKK